MDSSPLTLPTALTPRVIFEDPHLLVLSKPAGLLSQGEHTGDVNLVDYLRGYFGRNYVGLVHRLDRNTSGIMVVAKRSKAAERLTRALQNDQLRRVYLAWVTGTVPAEFRWEDRLEKDERANLVRVVRTGGKVATLAGVVHESRSLQGSPASLVELRLETGRSHQIRVQTSARGHPILGDVKYGGRDARERPIFSRPLLHSWKIEFPHPMSGEVLRFEDALPVDMRF